MPLYFKNEICVKQSLISTLAVDPRGDGETFKTQTPNEKNFMSGSDQQQSPLLLNSGFYIFHLLLTKILQQFMP